MANRAAVVRYDFGATTHTGVGTAWDRLSGPGVPTTEDVSPEPSSSGVIAMTAPPSRGGRTVPLQNLGSERLRLSHPLYVVLEESDGWFTALSYDLELAEQGETEFEALDALRSAVVELYEQLAEMGADAPEGLRSKLGFLESLRA